MLILIAVLPFLVIDLGAAEAETIFTDDFSTDSGAWDYLGSAYRDQTDQQLVLTTYANSQTGVAFFKTPIQDAFTASFSYKGNGDGFLLFFYKQEYPSEIAWEESYGIMELLEVV